MMKNFSHVIASACLVAMVGCSDKTTKSVAGSDLVVELESDPYALIVRSPDGETLLKSTPLDGPGTGPLAVRQDKLTEAKVLLGHTYFEAQEGTPAFATTLSELVEPGAPGVETSAIIRGDDSLTIEVTLRRPDRGLLALSFEQRGGPVSNRMVHAFECTPNDHFLGLGERFDSVDQRGRVVPVWAEEGAIGIGTGRREDLIPHGDVTAYMPIPFFLSTRGYGLVLNTTNRSEFDLCSTHSNRFTIEVWDNRLELTLAYGASPADILERYTSHVGRATLPPPFVFGPWNDAVQGEARVRQVGTALRENHIPSSVIWTEDWTGGRQLGSIYAITSGTLPDTELYRDLKGLADDLHKSGFRFLSYYYPWINVTDTERFREGVEKNYFVKTPDGEPYLQETVGGEAAIPDLTNTEVREWMKDIFRVSVDLGFDGWMADFAEWIPPDARFIDSRTGLEVHNQYPLLWQQLNREFWDEIRPDGDYLFFCRSGYTGTQKYAVAYFAGDPNTTWEEFDGLPSVLPAGLSAGISGASFWGSDIAGYTSLLSGPSTKELFFRWTQLGTFSPIMRTHHGMLAAQNWSFDRDAETLDHYGRYARLRAELFPYLYAIARQSTKTGMPMMRHLHLEFPDDPEVIPINDEYMLGPSLLVAPVIEEGADSRDVYFPKGTWFPLAGGAVVRGPGWRIVEAPLSDIPVFVRAGSIIPRLAQAPDTFVIHDPRVADEVVTIEDVETEYVLEVYLGADGKLELADGTRITLKSASTRIPPKLRLDGAAIPSCADGATLACRESDSGNVRIPTTDTFRLSGNGFSLDLNAPGPPRTYTITLIVQGRSAPGD